MTQSKFHCDVARTVLICGLVLTFLAALPDQGKADPAILTDQELEAVSARGFAFPGLGFGKQSSITTVTPLAATGGENDTDVKNLIFSTADTINVNTAVNTCVFAVCKNSGANIESNPTNQNQIDVTNDITPSVMNSVWLPTITNSFVGSGAASDMAGFSNAALNPASVPTTQGTVKTPPQLPQLGSWGSWGTR